MKKEVTLSSRLIYSGRAVRLRVDTIELPGGRQTTREIVEHADCVAVVVVDEHDDILLVRQYRSPIGKELIEIPAGCIDPGEDAEAAVRRELQEEIGYLPRKLTRLGGFYSTPGYGTEYLHLYLATDLVYSPLQAEDTAGITTLRVPLSQALGMVMSGEICDAKSIAGLLTYREYLKSR